MLIANGAASSVTDASPYASRARIALRVGSASAAKTWLNASVGATIQDEFAITQPAVSQHLKVLRDTGFASVRPEGQRRLYAVDGRALRDVDEWLGAFHRFWTPHLDALAIEIARGKRRRRINQPGRQHD